jgi:pilus assembly protein CpaB
MFSGKLFRYFVACFVGLVAVTLARVFLPARSLAAQIPSPAPMLQLATSNVIVAGERIARGSEIRPEQLKMLAFPSGTIPEGAMSDYDALWALGRDGLLPVSGIGFEPGEIILSQRVETFGKSSRAAMRLSEGMRALALKADDVSSVGGLIVPGDRVDIWVSEAKRRDELSPAVKLVAEGVRVLAVDREMDSDEETSSPLRSMTFEVSPEASMAILAAQQAGTITLALRPAGDISAETLPPKREAPKSRPQVRQKPASAAKAWTVKVTRGIETETQTRTVAK